MAAETCTVEWERVLWKRQPFPDNYVPRSFLSSLSTNGKAMPMLPANTISRSVQLILGRTPTPHSCWRRVPSASTSR